MNINQLTEKEMAEYKIQDFTYLISDERVTDNGIWARCSFTGDVSKRRNGQFNFKVVATDNPKLIADGVPQITDEAQREQSNDSDDYQYTNDKRTIPNKPNDVGESAINGDLRIELNTLFFGCGNTDESGVWYFNENAAIDLLIPFIVNKCTSRQQNAKEVLDVLSELYQVKQWKDEHGKDEQYLKAQPIAWKNARLILEKYNKIK